MRIAPLSVFSIAIMLACSTATINSNDLTGKVFKVSADAPDIQSMKGIDVIVQFNHDTTGVFHFAHNGMKTDRKFTWNFVGDSLRVSHIGNTSALVYSRMYAITKDPAGYLLKGRTEQMLLTEAK